LRELRKLIAQERRSQRLLEADAEILEVEPCGNTPDDNKT